MTHTTELKIARLRAGYKQQEVADLMGVHVQTYSNMEKHPDSMSIKDAKRFAEIVGVSVENLFFTSDSN